MHFAYLLTYIREKTSKIFFRALSKIAHAKLAFLILMNCVSAD